MSFVSFAFCLLFGLTLAARQTIGRNGTEPLFLWFLLLVSLVFYGWHVPLYLLLILLSASIDFTAGRMMNGAREGSATRRGLLVLSVTANLALLFVFKYHDFAISEVDRLLAVLHVPYRGRPLSLILPVGISFYTFQSMSYTIDIYRGRIRPVRSFSRFLLYVAFFPQLVAGPIVRAGDFLYQMGRRRRPNLRVAAEGIDLIIRGYFLKMVLADNLAIYVNGVWSRASRPGAPALLALSALCAFSCQIFCDFAGYSRIARGLAYLLGFRLPVNFRAPYIAGTFQDFWRRWHISLSSWLRDYLYLPLGGNRRGRLRTYANLMAVMLLGGLWHGAAWTFIVWGGLHGTGLALERLLGIPKRVRTMPAALRLCWRFLVQLTVLAGWAFFRSATAGGACRLLGNMTNPTGEVPQGLLGCLTLFVPVVLFHAEVFFSERGRCLPARFRAITAAVLLYAILTAHGATGAFIYFQF